MSTLEHSPMHDVVHASAAATDASFEHFIDSDLILDASSPALTPSTPSGKKEKTKPKALTSLASRLSHADVHRNTPSSPGAANELLAYAHPSGSSVNTPTSSNSSSLHNLNFDFFDAGEGTEDGASAAHSISDALSSPQTDMSSITAASMAPFGHATPEDLTGISGPLFGMDGVGPFRATMTPMNDHLPSFQRTVDDMGHQPGHQMSHHPAHHQRSLSLRDVAPPVLGMNPFIAGGPTNSFPFAPNVKLEADMMQASMLVPEILNSSSLSRNSPASSALSSSLLDRHSPPQEKKRKLMANKSGAKSATAKPNNAKDGAEKGATNQKRRIRSGTGPKRAEKKVESSTLPSASVEVDSVSQSEKTTVPLETKPESTNDDSAREVSKSADVSMERADSACPSDLDAEERAEVGNKQGGKKRKPPSSSTQTTESGLPFPVIDTTAKHSTLFVPPDMSGLTKHEARLVKNRAAAFLSRQRKREQLEELEGKCKSLSRLVWLLWEKGSMHTSKAKTSKSPFVSEAVFSNMLATQESDLIKDTFEHVLRLKGSSIASLTEEAQAQDDAPSATSDSKKKSKEDEGMTSSKASSSASGPSADASYELARLRAELDGYKKREMGLQAELHHERELRMTRELEAEERARFQQPFRAGGGKSDVSLTMPATFDDNDDVVDDDDDDVDGETSNGDVMSKRSIDGKKKRSGRASVGRPPRASQRLQNQHASTMSGSNNAVQSGAAGNQRKAASAALMMVLFSFALFGLPGGEIGANHNGVGGVNRAPGSSNGFPMGRVLGAPIVTGRYPGDDEDEEMELGQHLPPSSHLSADDLFPSSQTLQEALDREEVRRPDQKQSLTQSLQNIFNSNADGQGSDVEFTMDYQAFAKDLGNSLDWDMQRGFIVLGSNAEDGEDEKEHVSLSSLDRPTMDRDSGQGIAHGGVSAKTDIKDAPTKITLFVPAPPEMSNSPESDVAEDRFYDAPLATADAVDGRDEQRELTQAEATRAALQVLRNHRVAREAAAFAASRRLHSGASPSAGAHNRSPSPSLSSAVDKLGERRGKRTIEDVAKDDGMARKAKEDANDDEQEEEFEAADVVGTSDSAADRIRGTDFYQLEFSLSGAKVRNVAELARLFGSMRGSMVE